MSIGMHDYRPWVGDKAGEGETCQTCGSPREMVEEQRAPQWCPGYRIFDRLPHEATP